MRGWFRKLRERTLEERQLGVVVGMSSIISERKEDLEMEGFDRMISSFGEEP